MEKLEQNHGKLDTLRKFATDLTQMAHEGKLDPLIGREKELERVMQVLCKRRKNNPCLVGDPGIGKIVIIEGLAQKIVKSSVPYKLIGKKIFALDMARLIAGASNRGDFEERLINIIDEVKNSERNVILFIDEIHTIIGAGGTPSLDAANIMKPPLARTNAKTNFITWQCIGATTMEEYRKYVEKDAALERRFQPVQVNQPNVDETIDILKNVSKKYEEFHNVRYSEKALISAVKLSNQYISNRSNPDKAIDLIDEVGARIVLRQSQPSKVAQIADEVRVQQMISILTGVQVERISNEESKKLLNFEESLQKHVIGQPEAIEAISRVIRRAGAGIRNPNRPISSFLFTGPTGVGKTELANALAVEYFGSKDSLVRIDMSEYMEKHTVSKMFGSPPGYIGSENGGQLTNAVRSKPNAVVLFDEIEKAHGEVLNVLLQVLEDGKLTDNKGKVADFKNTILIMTSNVGASVIPNDGVLGNFESVKMGVGEELRKNFRPEFLNRIDEVIVFRKLGKKKVKEIVEKMIKEVCERVKERNIVIIVSENLKRKVMKEGFNPSYGARSLRRTISRNVEDPLADKILNGVVVEGDVVKMDVDDEGNVIVSMFND